MTREAKETRRCTPDGLHRSAEKKKDGGGGKKRKRKEKKKKKKRKIRRAAGDDGGNPPRCNIKAKARAKMEESAAMPQKRKPRAMMEGIRRDVT